MSQFFRQAYSNWKVYCDGLWTRIRGGLCETLLGCNGWQLFQRHSTVSFSRHRTVAQNQLGRIFNILDQKGLQGSISGVQSRPIITIKKLRKQSQTQVKTNSRWIFSLYIYSIGNCVLSLPVLRSI